MDVSGVVAALVVGLFAAASVAPAATVVSGQPLAPVYDRGLARSSAGWVVAGPNRLAHVSDGMVPERALDAAIPPAWSERGFDRIGDVDVAGTTLYVPFEQPDAAEGRQAMARYDADTLAFRDATVVDQHENSFVAVDGATGIAYSMDRSGGAALLRYDIRADWRRLEPLRMDQDLEQVQGAAVARDAVWLLTDDDRNTLYRVDIETGAVAALGPAPPVAGEGAGLDASEVGGDDLHATVVDPDRAAVTLNHLQVTGEPVATPPVAPGATKESPTSWPPALIYFAIFLAAVALAAVGTIFWRARTTIQQK